MSPNEIVHWYLAVLKKYVAFRGRAHRMEFWTFTLVNLSILVGLSVMGSLAKIAMGSEGISTLSDIYMIAVFLPSLAVSVRRLHDASHSGWFLLLGIIPVIGAIILLVMFVQDSASGDNRYGPNPKQSVSQTSQRPPNWEDCKKCKGTGYIVVLVPKDQIIGDVEQFGPGDLAPQSRICEFCQGKGGRIKMT